MRATLSDLKTRALRKANLPASTTTRAEAIVTTDELADVLNDGFDELHGIVLAERQNHLEVTSYIQALASIETTPLPDCWLSMRGVWIHDGGVRSELDEWKLENLPGTTTTDTSSRPRWRIQGSVIRWLPLPGSTYQIELVYLRSFRKLQNDADTIEPAIPEGWLRYPVNFAAAYCLTKQSLDPTPCLSEMQRIAQSISSLSLQKETGKSFVRDTSGRFDPESRRSRLPWPRK